MGASRVVICGWSANARRLIADLLRTHPQRSICLISDALPGAPDPPIPQLTRIAADPSTQDGLQVAALDATDVVVILAEPRDGRSPQDVDAHTLLTVLAVKKMCPGAYSIAELLSPENTFHAANAGVDEVLIADTHAGAMLSRAVQSPKILSVFTDLFRSGVGSRLYTAPLPPDLVDQPFSAVSAAVAARALGILIGLRRDRSVRLVPDPQEPLQAGDGLLLIQHLDPPVNG
ncbi:MAG: NAD-binding protein [Myxococcota bacterium]